MAVRAVVSSGTGGVKVGKLNGILLCFTFDEVEVGKGSGIGS